MSNTKNLANLASVLDDGTNGQVLQSTGSGGVAFADAGGTGVTVHDNQAAMLTDAVSAAEGTLHYDTNSNILYVKKASAGSSGFFLLASITNVTPQINTFTEATGGAGANNLSNAGSFGLTAGSNSVITINATDANLDTLTYSATVTSGTATNVISSPSFPVSNQSSNIFTLTPATSGGGSITIRFDVSDSSSVDSVTQTFSIQFSVTDSRFTRLMMTTDNTAGGNQSITYTNASGSNSNFTVNGDTYVGSFSPYRAGGYSTHFNGSTDYLTIADNSEHEFDGDFSIEFFWKPETVTGNTSSLHIALSCGNDSSTQFIYDESNYWYLQKGSGGAKALDSSGQGSAAVAGQWSHVVLCRSGTTMSIFHNGTRTATNSSYTATVDFSGSTIGRYFSSSANYYIDGLLRDMRWLKGSSAYDATQTSITVPTEALTAVTNTKLLLCHLPYIADGSSTGHTITLSGSTHTRASSPYDNQEYSESEHGGSVYLDGTGDSLTWTNNDGSFDVGISSSPFTIEWWQYMPSMPSGTYTYIGPSVGGGFGGWNSNNGHQYTSFLYSSNTQWRNQLWNGSALADITVTLNGAIKAGQWQHLVAVYDGTNYSHFVDGVRLQTNTTTTFGKVANATIAGIGVGPSSSTPGYFPGYISDLRIVKGSAEYSASSTTLTVPTAPLATVTNTTVHMKGTDAHVLDKSQSFNFQLKGGAAASTTQAKFSNTASVYFDGNGDYIPVISNFFYDKNTSNASTTKFTIETWVYHTARLSYSNYSHIFQTIVGLGEVHMAFGIDHNGYLKFYHQTNSNHLVTSSSTISLNTWTHIAVIVDGSQGSSGVTLKINGTTDGTGSWNGINSTLSYHQQGLSDPHFTIGRYPNGFLNYQQFEGYLQDLRISDTARTITAAPAGPLEG